MKYRKPSHDIMIVGSIPSGSGIWSRTVTTHTAKFACSMLAEFLLKTAQGATFQEHNQSPRWFRADHLCPLARVSATLHVLGMPPEYAYTHDLMVRRPTKPPIQGLPRLHNRTCGGCIILKPVDFTMHVAIIKSYQGRDRTELGINKRWPAWQARLRGSLCVEVFVSRSRLVGVDKQADSPAYLGQ